MTYSQSQREFWAKRPANEIKYLTVEFYHPDFGYIRLLANQFTDKSFDVDGVSQLFQATTMVVPEVTSQTTDETQIGSLSFGRIGLNVRNRLLQITPLGAIKNPIKTTFRQYRDGVIIYQRVAYVAPNGVAISSDNVNMQLTTDNPAKLTNEQAFYDPALWSGL